MKIVFCAWIALFCVSSTVFSQAPAPEIIEEDRTNRTETVVKSLTDTHKYHLGIFRIRPSLTFSSGYDTNALHTERNPVSDYYFTGIPEASVGLKLGRRAFFRVIEELQFVYYKELEQRRDIFSTTKAELTTGTRRLLVIADAGYLKRKDPVNEEIDIPVERETADAGVRTEYTLSRLIDLRTRFRMDQTELTEAEDISDLSFTLHDRRTFSGGAGIDYRLTDSLDAIADGDASRSEALDTGVISNYWSVLGGVQTHSRPTASMSVRKFIAHIAVGYGQGDTGTGDTSKNFLLDGSLDVHLGRRASVGGFANRRYQFSSLLDNSSRLTTQGGVRGSVPLSGRFTIAGMFTAGKNDYDDQLIGGVPVTKDNFQRGDLHLDVRIIHNLVLILGGSYRNRDTDIPDFNVDQVTYNIGLGFSVEL